MQIVVNCGALGKQLCQEEIRDAHRHKLSLGSVNAIDYQVLDGSVLYWFNCSMYWPARSGEQDGTLSWPPDYIHAKRR